MLPFLIGAPMYLEHTEKVFVQKKVREPPCSGGLKNAGAPLKVKIFFLTDVLFMVCKMTAQNTRTQQKKRERPSLPESRDICKNVSK